MKTTFTEEEITTLGQLVEANIGGLIAEMATGEKNDGTPTHDDIAALYTLRAKLVTTSNGAPKKQRANNGRRRGMPKVEEEATA